MSAPTSIAHYKIVSKLGRRMTFGRRQ